jgi:hypothetical protein
MVNEEMTRIGYLVGKNTNEPISNEQTTPTDFQRATSGEYRSRPVQLSKILATAQFLYQEFPGAKLTLSNTTMGFGEHYSVYDSNGSFIGYWDFITGLFTQYIRHKPDVQEPLTVNVCHHNCCRGCE